MPLADSAAWPARPVAVGDTMIVLTAFMVPSGVHEVHDVKNILTTLLTECISYDTLIKYICI